MNMGSYDSQNGKNGVSQSQSNPEEQYEERPYDSQVGGAPKPTNDGEDKNDSQKKMMWGPKK